MNTVKLFSTFSILTPRFGVNLQGINRRNQEEHEAGLAGIKSEIRRHEETLRRCRRRIVLSPRELRKIKEARKCLPHLIRKYREKCEEPIEEYYENGPLAGWKKVKLDEFC